MNKKEKQFLRVKVHKKDKFLNHKKNQKQQKNKINLIC